MHHFKILSPTGSHVTSKGLHVAVAVLLKGWNAVCPSFVALSTTAANEK